MAHNIELILDQCIAEMRKGKSVAEVISNYPEYSKQLLPLLQLAQEIEALPLPSPSPENVTATLVKIGQEMGRRETPKEHRYSLSSVVSKISFENILRRPVLAWSFAGALAFVVLIFSASTISAGSLPGDFLYPLKLVTEKVKYLLTFDTEKKAELRLTFSDKRLAELTGTLQRSKTLDTTLLIEMLDEAKLALEENKPQHENATLFLTKLSQTNAAQKNALKRIRSQVDPSNMTYVDKAIGMCDMRDRWMRNMMGEEDSVAPGISDTTHPRQLQHQSKRMPKQWNWGSDCDWNCN